MYAENRAIHRRVKSETQGRVERMSEKERAKCCFCGTIFGALIRLYQGWCCVDCFKKHILH